MEDTDVTLGFVHSKNLSEALTDSVTHQGKLYFPTDNPCIIKNGEMRGGPVIDLLNYVSDNSVLPTIHGLFWYSTIKAPARSMIVVDTDNEIADTGGVQTYYHVFAAEFSISDGSGFLCACYDLNLKFVRGYFSGFNDCPDIIKRAYGLATADTEHNGLLAYGDYAMMKAHTDGLPFSFASGKDTKHTILSNVMLSSVSRVIFEITNNVSDIGVGVGDDGSNAKSVMAAGIYEYTPSEYHLFQGKYNINVWGTEAIEGKVYIR